MLKVRRHLHISCSSLSAATSRQQVGSRVGALRAEFEADVKPIRNFVSVEGRITEYYTLVRSSFTTTDGYETRRETSRHTRAAHEWSGCVCDENDNKVCESSRTIYHLRPKYQKVRYSCIEQCNNQNFKGHFNSTLHRCICIR